MNDCVAPLARSFRTVSAPPLLRRYRLGLALACSAVVMVFVAFSSAYIVRRGIPTYDLATGAYSATWEQLQLPSRLVIVATLLLLAASGLMEMTRRSERRVSLFVITSALLVLGFAGVAGVIWRELQSSGHFMNSGARAAFFYVLTVAHAVLAIFEIIALVSIGIRQRVWSDTRRRMAIDLGTWYMHFVTTLWIYVALFVRFA